MAQDFKDYDELLKLFEDEPKKKSSSQASEKSAKSKSNIDRVSQERQRRVQNFDLNLNAPKADKTPHNRGEVYFSNSPQDIKDSIRARSAKESAARAESSAKKPEKSRAVPPPTTDTQKKVLKLKALKKAEKAKKRTSKKSNGRLERFLKKGNRKASLTKAALYLAIIAFFSVILCVYGIGCINDILAINRNDSPVEVTISDGMTDGQVINILKKNHLIKNKLFCKAFIKAIHITDSPKYTGGEYVTGIYTLTPSMGLEKMLSTVQADFTLSETIKLTFPEGWTADQIAQKLEANEVCSASSFITTLQTVDFSEEYPFLKNLGSKEERFRVLEGYLYPDTYDFYIGENASSVIRRFLDNFKSKWIESYSAEAEKLGMSVDEVMTVASILQKEAADTTQMATIASVIYNRLDSSNFQWLQCDSTETYLLETIKPTLTSSTEDTEKYIRYRDLYDTYSTECKGLPIGPICNPGDSAIYAALHPDDTSYFYFRHDDEGNVYYASTFAEHEQNGRKIANNS